MTHLQATTTFINVINRGGGGGGGGGPGSRARPTTTTRAMSAGSEPPCPRRRPAVVSQPPTTSTTTTSTTSMSGSSSSDVLLEDVINFRDLADADAAGTLSLAPNRVFRTATLGNASDKDATAILTEKRVARLLDLRSEDEWEQVPGLVQDVFTIRPFSRAPLAKQRDDKRVKEFERAIAEDAAANRLVRYHTPLLDYNRYYGQILARMTTVEKLQVREWGGGRGVTRRSKKRKTKKPKKRGWRESGREGIRTIHIL